MGILGSAAKLGYKLGKDRDMREWVSWESQAVTTDVQPRGKYETTKTSATLLAEHSEGSQSKEASLFRTRSTGETHPNG